MSSTFNCPHCNATYPVLPTLYGRAVRCSSCKNPFRLRGDGVVEKVGAKASGDKPKTRRPERSEEEKNELTASFLQKSEDKKQEQKKQRVKGPDKKSINELRKSVSGALKDAAEHVISEEKTEKKRGTARISKKKVDKDSISAVLNNQGENEHKLRRGILLVAVLFCVALYIALQMYLSETEQEQALRAYSAQTDSTNARERHRVYLNRNWMFTYDGKRSPLIILDTEHGNLGEVYDLDLTVPTTLVQDMLTGLSDLPELAMWIDKNKIQEAQIIWAEKKMNPPLSNFYSALKKKNINFVTYVEFVDALKSKGVDDEAILMYSMMLAGTTDERGSNTLAEKILIGNGPMRCEVANVTGTDGREFALSAANKEAYRSVRSYRGNVIRFVSEFWEPEWRIFLMERSDYTYQNPLLMKEKIFRVTAFRAYELERRSREQE
ncbi:MAG: hypothetical protein HRU15_02935 [Planctomycetes bacterium]|nr:hypothetical protein [Planctomycetota bacterium]